MVTRTDFDEERVDPIIQVNVGSNEVPAKAFMDLGTQGNIISISLFNKMAPTTLQLTTHQIKGYTGKKTNVRGIAIIPIQIGFQDYSHKFYIVED